MIWNSNHTKGSKMRLKHVAKVKCILHTFTTHLPNSCQIRRVVYGVYKLRYTKATDWEKRLVPVKK